MMKEAGYRERKQRKKSFKDFFATAIKLAEKHHGKKRSVKAWQKEFMRLRQECSSFIARLSESGCDGDDPELLDKTRFFEQLHALERGKARHSSPAVICSENTSNVSDLPLSSSRKRLKLSNIALLQSFFEEETKRYKEIIAEIKRGNEEKAKMRSVIERLVEKL